MKKVLFLSFIFFVLSCARDAKSGNSSPVINTKEPALTIVADSITDQVEVGKVKVYIENTLSMYGYLPEKKIQGSGFRDAVNELLIASKTTYNKKNVELFLINNETSVSINIDNNLDKIDSKSLGNSYSKGRGSSDFDKLFGKIISEWEEDEVVVFIADFIYSPGNTEVISGLNGLRMNITDAFQNAKGSKPLAVNILHLESDFHGPYYYYDNKSVSGIGSRPYYIFILGSEKNVKKYSEEVVPKLNRYNLKNDYNLTPSSTEITNYSALPFTLNDGQFESNSFTPGRSQIKSFIVKNSTAHNSNVQLAVSADLKGIPVSEEYLMDIDNYRLSDDRIKIIDIGKIENKSILLSNGKQEVIKSHDIGRAKSTSHAFLISFPSTYKGEIKLSLKKNMPEWVEQVSIKDGDNDRDIETNVLKQSQTFGFNYIVEGIYNAQENANPENEYFRISLVVDQEKSGSGMWTVFGWIIGLLFIGAIVFIIFKNKQRK